MASGSIYSISGRVSSVTTSNGTTTVTIDSTAYGTVPPKGTEGPLNNFFYGPGQISAGEMAVLSAANSTDTGVTVYFQMNEAGRSITAVREIASTPITVNQNMFMCGSSRWSPKGLCYQPVDGTDPLSDDNLATLTSLLDPATPYGLFNLGINCLRVYQVDPTANHDKVMQLLANNGIYVLVGAVNSATAITPQATSVPAVTVTRVKAVADAFARYNNVMGFSISNELLDSDSPSEYGLVSIVKQVKQQMQTHMKSKNYRAIPIGCATRDDPGYTFPATEAFTCGSPDVRMDFIGYNCYRWVVENGTTPSPGTVNQYYLLYNQFKNFPVPVMLTEIGADCPNGRDWSQVPYIFGQQPVVSMSSQSANMADAISGCFAFRYCEQGAGFGLVTPPGSPNPTAIINTTKVPPSMQGGGYSALSAAYNNVPPFSGTPNGVTKVDCSSLKGNPYAGNNPSTGGLPAAVSVTLTNDITNPSTGRNIAFSYAMVANPGSNDWIPAVNIPALGASQQFTFPAGTQAISMSFEVNPTTWYGGCQLTGANLLALQNNDTIQGQAMGGTGTGACPVITA